LKGSFSGGGGAQRQNQREKVKGWGAGTLEQYFQGVGGTGDVSLRYASWISTAKVGGERHMKGGYGERKLIRGEGQVDPVGKGRHA